MKIPQTILTAIIFAVMVSGFAGVYAATTYYESNHTSELLYISDSDLEFSAITINPYFGDLHPDPFTISTLYYNYTSERYDVPATPVYSGNNTWSCAMSSTPPGYDYNVYHIPIVIPNIETYLIDTVNISFSPFGGYDDCDISTYLVSSDNPVTIWKSTILQSHVGLSSSTWNNISLDLSSYQALQVYSYANTVGIDETALYMDIVDSDGDYLHTWAMTISVQIYGSKIVSWSLQDYVNLTLGISLVGNVIIGTFMLDSVDFKNKTKDLKSYVGKSRRAYKRKKSRKGR